ncbi:class I SAM-dependent methyltransferase family protein, partial [Candidatus Bathyarchaeota archaeon]|nr:class I SAM-dependent methyltransferase family protein [Candidatus Bathyarchaeota archaeon]
RMAIPKSLDIIGDIAILRLPESLWEFRNSIGKGILSLYPRIRLVMAEKGAVYGMERIRDLEVIAGNGSTETMHRENGCVFRLDVSKVYFSPRLSFERQRVASTVSPGETVIDLFAGVGPFSIQIAKRLKNGRVYAIDINPYAIKYLMENVIENKVQGFVTVLEGDARELVEERLKGIGERIIMNLPSRAFEFLDTASKALKPEGGIIHFYSFARDPDPLKDMEESLKNSIESQGGDVRILAKRIVREIAPHKYQVVLDAFVRPGYQEGARKVKRDPNRD